MGYSPWGRRRVGHTLATKEQQENLKIEALQFKLGHSDNSLSKSQES